jgi:NAD(P)-dependent dehydrogenase (short-subunit alcohol dehydrogenase family)
VKEFKDKVAVITGAASGIGRGLAERCAYEGMKVVLAGINENTLRLAENDLKAKGASTLVVQTDVSKAGDVEALAQKTLGTFGAVHLLFNNAGVGGASAVWGNTLADWEWTLGVNLWGVIYGIYFFLPIMLKQKTDCHIVNTASISGLFVLPGLSPYGASKHGVAAISEGLYRQMEHEGSRIGVSVLCPGLVKSDIMASERNRPAHLRNSPGEEQANRPDPAIVTMLQKGIVNGMVPAEVADSAFKAIREKKFYILPNAENAKPMIRARMEDILQERNPTSFGHPPK